MAYGTPEHNAPATTCDETLGFLGHACIPTGGPPDSISRRAMLSSGAAAMRPWLCPPYAAVLGECITAVPTISPFLSAGMVASCSTWVGNLPTVLATLFVEWRRRPIRAHTDQLGSCDTIQNLPGIPGASRLGLLRVTSLAFASKTRQTYAFPRWVDTSVSTSMAGYCVRKVPVCPPCIILALFSIKFRTRHLGCDTG